MLLSVLSSFWLCLLQQVQGLNIPLQDASSGLEVRDPLEGLVRKLPNPSIAIAKS